MEKITKDLKNYFFMNILNLFIAKKFEKKLEKNSKKLLINAYTYLCVLTYDLVLYLYMSRVMLTLLIVRAVFSATKIQHGTY